MIKENIRMLRNVNGYSQEVVAEKIGISRQAYAKWEKGKNNPHKQVKKLPVLRNKKCYNKQKRKAKVKYYKSL